MSRVVLIFFIAAIACLCVPYARAEYGRTPETSIDPSIIMIDEESFLGTKVDEGLTLLNREGEEFTIGSLLGRPVILVFSYFNCDGACPTSNMSLRKALEGVEGSRLGKDYRVLTVSFDQKDGVEDIPMFEKMAGLGESHREGWKVAVVKSPEDIERLTSSVGFDFFWSGRDNVFIHPNVYIFLSPEGRVVRFLYSAAIEGVDIGVALAEAGFGTSGRSKVKDLSDLLLIACWSYNFEEGRYTLNYPLFIAMGSLFGGLSLIGFSIVISKKKARR